MLRLWSVVLLLGASVSTASAAAPVESLDAAGILALEAPARAEHLRGWRLEAGRRLVRSAQLPEDHVAIACRSDRDGLVRSFLSVLEVSQPILDDPSAREARRETAAQVVVRAWRPVAAVEVDAPCRPDPLEVGAHRISSSAPDERPQDGLADLPELAPNDPMTLGPDWSGRRALRP